MDHRGLVNLVRQYPQIWDRNSPLFRDKDNKEKAWDEVARTINVAVDVCKDTFKSLREKYLREREKVHLQGECYKAWELIHDFNFLDPHILTRAAAWNGSTTASEDDVSINSDIDPTDFDTRLISLVKDASSIWDRNSNTYPNKTSKSQLWNNISTTLNRDVNTCMLRWKALREKYIRQRVKFQEGDAKWELLDHLGFLDKVIQYRRKQSDVKFNFNDNGSSTQYIDEIQNGNRINKEPNDYIRCNMRDESSNADSSNDFLHIVKEETIVQRVADSSYNTNIAKRLRKNSISGNSEVTLTKRFKTDEVLQTPAAVTEDKDCDTKVKTPEQLFGDLVASLLSRKPENQRNLYMIEIMTLLSK